MKIIKLIVVLIITFLLSGCSIEYELTIDEKTMDEKINVKYLNNKENRKMAEELIETPISSYYNSSTNQGSYYSAEILEKKDDLYIVYNYKYKENNLRNSNAFNACYYKRNVINNDEVIIINAEGAFTCLYDDYSQVIDDVVIKIKTELKVVESNADEVKGNQYIWRVDEENYKDKPIYIEIDKTKKSLFGWVSQFITSILIIIIVPLIVGSIIFIFRMKSKKVNEI